SPRPRPARGSRALARRGREGAFSEELAQAQGVARRERLVLVLEVRVDAHAGLQERPQPCGPVLELSVRIGRLAQAQVAEPRLALERADDRGAAGADAGPRLVPKVERPLERGVERVQQPREELLVVGLLDDDPHRPEPLAERAYAFGERGRAVRVRHLHGEPEAGRRLGRPAPELLLLGQPVSGRVQLDGVEALGVVAQELALLRPGRIETGLPGWVRPAGCADERAVHSGSHSRADALTNGLGSSPPDSGGRPAGEHGSPSEDGTWRP